MSNWLAEKVGGVCIGNGVDNTVFKCLGKERDIDVLVIPRDAYWKGNYLSVIEKLKDLNLNVYVVDGFRSENCLVDLYNRSKVFLFLSLTEGFGLPPLEAMACGCSVVSTWVCEFYNKNNCVFVPFKASAKEICGLIKKVLGDKELQRKLTCNGLLTARQLDFKFVVKTFETLITASQAKQRLDNMLVTVKVKS